MRYARRHRGRTAEFGGSGEDSFVAVVVTKLTGALLFILLLTMVIMALIPRAATLDQHADQNNEPLQIASSSPLPDAIVGRPYNVTLATRGGTGSISWSLDGELPEGLRFDPDSATIAGTPTKASANPSVLLVRAQDRSGTVQDSLLIQTLEPASAPTLPSNSELAGSTPTLRHWLEQGFGYVLLAGLWIAGLGIVGSVESWSRASTIPPRDTSRRFLGYKFLVSAAAIVAALALHLVTHSA